MIYKNQVNVELVNQLIDEMSYTFRQVAAVLNCSANTVKKLCNTGELESHNIRSTDAKWHVREVYGKDIKKYVKNLTYASAKRNTTADEERKPDDGTITTLEAAMMLDTSPRSINKLCDKGLLESYIYKHRRYVYKTSVETYALEHGISIATEDAAAGIEEIEEEIDRLQSSLAGLSYERQLVILKKIQDLSIKRRHLREKSNRDEVQADTGRDVPVVIQEEIAVSIPELEAQLCEVKKKINVVTGSMSHLLATDRKQELLNEYRELRRQRDTLIVKINVAKEKKGAENAAANVPTEEESRDSVVRNLIDEVESLRKEIEVVRQDVFANQKRLDCHAGRLKDVEDATASSCQGLNDAAIMCNEIADIIKRTVNDNDEQN